MSLDDDLDALYGVPPEEFTALRKELAAAAKKAGDVEVAKAIAGARRPTTAAWVVNALVHHDPTVRRRLADFTAELKAAHAAMDGDRIRELSRAQRALVAELVRSAFAAAGVDAPGAALRDDVTGTLQAAIADADVAGRLGRLEKAERWSGFGDFGEAAEVGTASHRVSQRASSRASERAPSSAPPPVDGARLRGLQRARKAAAAGLSAAESALDAATGAVADRTAALVAARRRYEKLLETLSAAEYEVETADAELEAAREAADGAESACEAAKSELAQIDSEIADVRGESPT